MPDNNVASPSNLSTMDGFGFPVSYTTTSEARARFVAGRMKNAVAWIEQQVGIRSVPWLFVVGPDEWDQVSLGHPYGLPHVGQGRIVVGHDAGSLWEGLLDTYAAQATADGWNRLTTVYGDPPDLSPFTDLLVVHELGHVTHGEPWTDDPVGFWLDELASNVILHGYVEEVEPRSLPDLETLFEVIWETPPDIWPVRDLNRMAESLAGDGTNYLWLEFGLQTLAGRLWRSAGATALRGIVDLLRGPARPLDEVLDTLATYDSEVAHTLRHWCGGQPV